MNAAEIVPIFVVIDEVMCALGHRHEQSELGERKTIMRKVSRRGAIVGAMKTGAYVAPAILSVSLAAPVGAISPAPGPPVGGVNPAPIGGSLIITFSKSGQVETIQATGLQP